MNQIKTLAQQLGPMRLAVMGAVAALLLGVLAVVALRGGTPTMGYLFTDLDPSTAQSIGDKLKAQNVPFQLSPDGTGILAPQDKLAELRMSLASDRLGGKVGYDVLDQEQPFGISASRAKLDETRAIEGELAKSIQTLDRVSGARVHLVMPERAMFDTDPRKASASVSLRTQGRLASEAVQAIRYMVASAVPELAPEAISIVDQTGALLARAGDASDLGGAGADERQAQVETKLRDQIEALLAPIVGEGKVRAEVSAQIDRAQTREESDVFDPDKQVVAHQTTVESTDQNSENSGAPPSASVSAQLPDAQGQQGGNGDSRTGARKENSEDTTYDNSKTHSTVLRAPGAVTKLTVAVMIDGGPKGLPADQIQRLQRLVENAVGIDRKRGDNVAVESMTFAKDDTAEAAKAGFLSKLPVDQLFGVLKLLLIAVAGLIALRMLKPKGAAESAPTPAPTLIMPTPEELTALTERAAAGDPEAQEQIEAVARGEAVPQLDQSVAIANVEGGVKLSVLRNVGDAISASPPEAAAIIRQWMSA